MTIDDELREEALHALREAFSGDLQQLVNAYKAAAAGLDDADDLGNDLVQIYTWPDATGVGDMQLNLYGDWPASDKLFGNDWHPSCGYATLAEAFEDERAQRIWLQGEIVFVRRAGEWMVPTEEEKK